MRRILGLLAVVLALSCAAACSSTASHGSTTGATDTPGPSGTASASPSASGNASPSASGNASASQTLAAGGVANLPNPKQRMFLGAYTDLTGQRSISTSVAGRVKAMGRPYDLQVTYYNWTDPFPDQGEAAIAAAGAAPVMAWYLPDKDPNAGISLDQVTSGADDKWISTQATAVKTFGHRIYLRLGPEMNGNWYGYSASPAAYIAAWRHIWTVFQRVGATNVTWVWCPNIGPADWDTYYPGNQYVDVIGVDGFSNIAYTWQTFQQMFGGFFAHFAAFAPGKPQLVVETATDSGAGTPEAGVGSAASFISGMATYLEDVAGPKYDVIGVCWFDTNTNNSYNWRVDQTAASWQAWLNLARSPYFGGHGSLGRLGRLPSVGSCPSQRTPGRSAAAPEPPACRPRDADADAAVAMSRAGTARRFPGPSGD